jgi:hypothetical protein
MPYRLSWDMKFPDESSLREKMLLDGSGDR